MAAPCYTRLTNFSRKDCSWPRWVKLAYLADDHIQSWFDIKVQERNANETNLRTIEEYIESIDSEQAKIEHFSGCIFLTGWAGTTWIQRSRYSTKSHFDIFADRDSEQIRGGADVFGGFAAIWELEENPTRRSWVFIILARLNHKQ